MLNLAPLLETRRALEADTYAWFTNELFGHMGKWQYMEPEYKNDPVNGATLWDIWEQEASKGDNMLKRQSNIIAEQIDEMAELTKPCHSLIDLGPGGLSAVSKNTVPFIDAFLQDLTNFVAVDMAEEAAMNAANYIDVLYDDLETHSVHDDFLNRNIAIPHTGKTIALMMGGTIGNFEAMPNTPNAVRLMANRLQQLKRSLPDNTTLFIGLEATQDPDILYADYDHLAHAEYEINLMHGIKRDLLWEEDGFNPYAWKYEMKWYPESYQFCHIAEATELQRFELMGEEIRFPKGTQLIVDNSFKFPVLAMQRAAQMAKTDYLRPFSDPEDRMVIHALKL